METIFWLILFVILLLIEIATLGLTTIWFAGGSLIAFIMSFVGFSLPVQIVVFLVTSIALLVITRPIAVKYFNKERQLTNAESLIGQKGIVLEKIDTLRVLGRVEVNGQEWAAKTDEPDGVIEENAVVSIEGIQGAKLIVKLKEE